ncbi:hypothetical protein [Halegenticoccus tardaugens]|uniref:hypothetical protein n=1 Tax=Halegenticoccus tardaugens TaxID=2071624 RepID=UPI00100B8AD9|nr:hypothetical protein [Halegenticoccus tardaugens]
MVCVSCGLQSGYNRAVVELTSGVELGGFCRSCEIREFGRSLERGRWSLNDGCALCSRDGHFALPAWEPTATERDGDIVGSVEYRVTDRTVALCDEHFHEVVEGIEDRRRRVRTRDPV